MHDSGKGMQLKMPTEMLISETRELEMANLGFIPLSYYKNSDYACFFSANSVQKPAEYADSNANANSMINSRLPYIFLVSRLAHYLKVLQRENIGSSKSRQVLENELNGWLQTLVTRMKDPEPELIATHPLRDGKVTVSEIPENPGYFSVDLFVQPHFQIEGVDVQLKLVAQMPRDNS
jgi:type VI secretion system protein ImpC